MREMAHLTKDLLYKSIWLLAITLVASETAITRLQRTTDYLLQTVINIRQDYSNLKSTVDNLERVCIDKEQSNAAQNKQPENKIVSENVTVQLHVLESKLVSVGKGFRDEKEFIRQQMDIHSTRLNELGTHLIDETSRNKGFIRHKIRNIENTLNETKENISMQTERITSKIDTMYTNIEKDIKDNIEIIDVNSKHLKRIKALGKMLAFFIPQIDKTFTLHKNSLYKMTHTLLTWNRAKQKCIKMGGHLPEVKDQDELNFINNFARNPVWVGATDNKNEGDWRWDMSGDPVDKRLWNEGEPNNQQGKEHCGETHANILNDQNCVAKFYYVCEFSY